VKRRFVDAYLVASLLALTAVAAYAWWCPFALDYGEGPLCDQARRLLHGEGLYRADWTRPPYTVDNYPPIYPLLLAGASRLLHLSLLRSGRLLSMLAALASALLLGRVAAHGERDPRAGMLAAALFLSHLFVLEWAMLARVDLVALAFSLTALAIVQARPCSTSWVLTAASCAVLAAFTKQTYALAAPVACAWWLARHRRANLIVFVAAASALATAAALALDHATAGGFWRHVVIANVNRWEPGRLGLFAARFACVSAPAIALAILVWRRMPAPWPRALIVYAASASAAGLTVGKVGACSNHLLEPVAALSLLAAAAAPLVLARRAVFRALAAQAAWSLVVAVAVLHGKLAAGWQDRAGQRAIAEAVDAARGPVLADEAMVTVVGAGRPLEYQPFELRQLEDAGRFSPSVIASGLARGRYPLVLLSEPGTPTCVERWGPEILGAVARHYVEACRAGRLVAYVPRAATPPGPLAASLSPPTATP